jgi:hypothetical protein
MGSISNILRSARRSAAIRRSLPRFELEMIEPRLLMSAAPSSIAAPLQLNVGVNVNITREPGNQAESAIAIDPTHPTRLFEVSNIDFGDFLVAGVSSDSGATWSTRHMADGADGLPAACCDPSVAFDSKGNLFITYLSANFHNIEVGMSSDGGRSFKLLATFTGNVEDQPTIATGPGSVWLVFRGSKGKIVTTSAAVKGLGKVGAFNPLVTVPSSSSANYADIAVGAAGQVLVTYQTSSNNKGSSTIWTNLDPDGLGPAPFGPAVAATTTNVGGFDVIPAMSDRGIDAEAGVVWDRSGGIHNGRAYLLYTDESPYKSDDTDVFVRYSDDQGSTWSAPVRVNDDHTSTSQFLPRIAIDQTTGNLAVTWHDCRNDAVAGASGDTDGIMNDDAQLYGTISTDGGATFLPNVRISAGTSNAADADNSVALGDFTGLDFYAGAFYPAWADNSNSTGDNPAGALTTLDVYTARVTAAAAAAAAPTTAAAPIFSNLAIAGSASNADLFTTSRKTNSLFQ